MARRKSREEIARNMSAIRSSQNRAEIALRKALHMRGFLYRLYRADLPGTPDIVFVAQRVSVA